MVVDLIGIDGLKGPYCTLTTTNWFLQALSVIPMGSWGDVSRCSYHDPIGKSHKYWIRDSRTDTQLNVLSIRRGFWGVRLPKSQQRSNGDLPMLRGKTLLAAAPSPLHKPPPPPPPCAAAAASSEFVPANLDEKNPSTPISSGLLVQDDEGIPSPVVDLIDVVYRNLP
ncbi:hypothetical protein F511_13381 [Dorcoceras hygrometricum]|uniref:Uncharacterized protein n=1 Tax=Dorcoceras hygrometricum TaxID=472368 RepID=A0A2Z7BC83_9LAMI|nr:hypothetical protein F511_13381 [Dorcoceras hygrometricum]